MKFITESGSTYEVDEENKRVRRLAGKADPTPRQGKDGEWKSYKAHAVCLGIGALFLWDKKTTPLLPGSEEGTSPVTMTSPVKEILP